MKRSLVGNADFFCQLSRHRRGALGLGVGSLPLRIALPVRLAAPRLTFSVVVDHDYLLGGLRQLLSGVVGHFAIASFGLFVGARALALLGISWIDCLRGLERLLGLDGLLHLQGACGVLGLARNACSCFGQSRVLRLLAQPLGGCHPRGPALQVRLNGNDSVAGWRLRHSVDRSR
jgi:hypothetical protein